MATPKKAIPPKKTKETKTPSSRKKDDNNNNKKKTSNGSVAAVRSPSAKSQKNREQNGGKNTKTPTPKSNKGKRVREEEAEEKEDVKSYTFPMERIKRIIRAEDSDLRISSDAVFLVNKATEKFLEKFSEDAHKCCVKDRKKAIAYKHLSSVVCKQKRYDFLSDFVPERVKAEDALAKRKQSEAGTS
ncbi:hypothetical protein M0R45_016838 [Rubus argutus]|uniref:Transcription factor CBF/NF-Y/archaeal histone domain-containing protein n=1 Tax=Rubus argutus TaxID=59490 RepID=A0AAW1XVP4_RUBAR